MNDSKKNEFIKAFESADDAVRENRNVIFGSEANRLRQLYAARDRRFKAWNRSGPCLYRGCPSQSIPRSHAVHRAQALDGIAENQHVLTPALDQTGVLRLQRVGVRIASTFPGFCIVHEGLFADFESVGAISTGRHIALQMFRTLCREIARKRHGIEQGKKDMEAYRAIRNEYYLSAISPFLPDITTAHTTDNSDGAEKYAVTTLEEAENDLRMLEQDFYQELISHLETGSECAALCTEVPIQLPVSLSGYSFVSYSENGTVNQAPCVIGVIPQGKGTILFMGTPHRHERMLTLWKERLSHGFGVLNAVESWMLYGSDHWFLRPSIWNSLPSERQERILKDIASTDGNMTVTVAPSIFDEMRRWLIEEISRLVPSMDEIEREATLKALAVESAKLEL